MRTLRLVTVVGARPQFIKAATVSRAIRGFNDAAGDLRVEETILHTGQHYDDNMSGVFFEELQMPPPAVNLGVAARLHGEQTAAMLAGLEAELVERRPDRVLVYGDTNSTLAGALAAVKLGVPVAHVEAGLRSFDPYAPEEINRVVTDAVSDLLLCPTRTAVANLRREGKGEGVHLVGDVMLDSLLEHAPRSEGRCRTMDELGLGPREFYLATIHRAENTDRPHRLAAILEALGRLEAPVILPLHPRTRKAVAAGSLAVPPSVRLVAPASYLEMLALERHARLILTDSGGVQREAYWLAVPCVTLRAETEWVELVEAGCSRLAGTDPRAILEAVRAFEAADARLPPGVRSDLLGRGQAAAAIVGMLAETA